VPVNFSRGGGGKNLEKRHGMADSKMNGESVKTHSCALLLALAHLFG